MNVKKCANGHFFDADKYQLCPHCGASLEQSAPPSATRSSDRNEHNAGKRKKDEAEAVVRSMPQKTMGKTFGVFDDAPTVTQERTAPSAYADIRTPVKTNPDDNGKKKCPTCGKMIKSAARFCKFCGNPVEQDSEGKGKEIEDSVVSTPTEKITSVRRTDTESTASVSVTDERSDGNDKASVAIDVTDEATSSEAPREKKQSLEESLRSAVEESDGRTVGFFSLGNSTEPTNADPVVGWLVCVKGKHFGESFQIVAGRNSVGRGATNKISIRDDNSVSREKHTWITYDPKHRVFFIQPGESSGLSYLNGGTVMETKKMAARDQIEIGDGIYLLIPLCDESFSWEDYIK